jgi:hypothetical protein
MKASRALKGMSLAIVLLLATNAHAAKRAPLHIIRQLNVNDQALPAGEYTVLWGSGDGGGEGDEVSLSILNDTKRVATVRARWVTLNAVSKDDAAVVSNADGVRRLIQIRFAGKKQALEIIQEPVVRNEQPANR